MKGFLGTGATFGADLNLVVPFIMGTALIAGLVSRNKDATKLTELAKPRCFF
jgi:hypothetical protein